MNKQEKIEARLANTEKALFALVAVLQEVQAPYMQESLNLLMEDYFDANTSLGFNPRIDFIEANG